MNELRKDLYNIIRGNVYQNIYGDWIGIEQAVSEIIILFGTKLKVDIQINNAASAALVKAMGIDPESEDVCYDITFWKCRADEINAVLDAVANHIWRFS